MSATITIAGTARVTDDLTWQPLADPDRLAKVAGLHETEETISEYFDEELSDLEITGGDLRLALGPDGKEVRIVSTFLSPQKLTRAQLKLLARDTVGQWSDGIGEGCFGIPAKDLQVTVDLLQRGKPKVEQVVQDEPKGKKRPRARAADLVKAAEAGELEKVQELLAAGANPNGKDGRELTALSCAASEGHPDVVEALLAGGADVNAVTWSGTALNWAARSAEERADRNVPVARILLAAGADPKLVKDDWGGRTSLSWAAGRGGPEIVKLLLDAGADPTLRNNDKTAPTAAEYLRKTARRHGVKSSAGKQYLAAAEVIEERVGSA
jgi:hypothetical protein